MITTFAPNFKIFKIVGIIYVAIVWWAAMYLKHHYFVDLLGGAVFTAFSYFVSTQIISMMVKNLKHRIYSRGNLKWCMITGDKGKDIELVIIDFPESFEEKQTEKPRKDFIGETAVPLLKEQ